MVVGGDEPHRGDVIGGGPTGCLRRVPGGVGRAAEFDAFQQVRVQVRRLGDDVGDGHAFGGAGNEQFRRTAVGYDTQDLELDFIVYPNGQWSLKDDELMDQRVAEGRWTAERVADIRADGRRIAARLEAGERWWPDDYRHWAPDPDWSVPEALPAGWTAA